MIYGGEQLIQYPVKDLFDRQMMALSINAAKDMYEKGLQLIKDFYEKYGDFTSPILKDMDWYNQNVTGKARDTINNLYANGIDPLRSAEGRAAVQLLIYSMPVGDIAKVKLSAETAKEYVKNRASLLAKGLWNPDMESLILGGNSIENWDTINNGLWARTSPTEYQDLNKYTSHIFDSLEDSYMGTQGPYDWYGVSESDMYRALTPDTLGGLVNSDLGRFHYNNAKNDLIAQGVENPTDQQIMDQFRYNIVAANHEKTHRNRKINEMYKLNREHDSRMAAARESNPQKTNQYSIAELIRRTSSTRIVGQQTQEYSKETLAKQRDAQLKKGLEISKAADGNSTSSKARVMYREAYQDNSYSAAVLTDFIANQGFEKAPDEPNTVIVPKHQFKRLTTLANLSSNTTGFRGKEVKDNLQDVIKNAEVLRVTFTGGNYGAYMKNATNQNHFECIVKKGYMKKNDKGELVPIYVPLKIDKTNGIYFDSHITSQPDDPRTGYLGLVDKRTGKVKDVYDIPITNSQDSKYQDAVMSDVYTTAPYIKGSDYDYDAIYTEIPNWGSTK